MALSGMDFYLRGFQDYQRKGLDAYRAGEMQEARFNLLKASEFLYKLSRGSEGKLREKRADQARRLLDRAKAISPNAPNRASDSGPGPMAEGKTDSSKAKFEAVERPTISFADVAGLEHVKEEIRLKMIYPFTHPEAAERFRIRRGGGVLLFGPPGTGKTMLGRAVAGEIEAAFFTVKPSEIMSKWVGEAEQNIAELFRTARTHERSIIFIDEIEAVAPARTDSGSSVMQRVVPQILAELDGFESADANPMLFLGATNKPWNLDPAIMRPGRFDDRIYVSLPDQPARRKILELNLTGRPCSDDVDVDQLAQRLDGYSGADIKNICEEAAQQGFLAAVNDGDEVPITMAGLEQAATDTKPSVLPQDLKRFDSFAQGGERSPRQP